MLFNNTLEKPQWFENNLKVPYKSKYVCIDGCNINYLHWKPTKIFTTLAKLKQKPPSVVFIHGTSAHAHWFHHIAPFFCQDGYEAIAISLSGHGDSQSRKVLGRGVWEKEVIAVCQDANLLLNERAAKPILVGHSLGSHVAEETARLFPSALAGIVILDGGVPHPMYWYGVRRKKKKAIN